MPTILSVADIIELGDATTYLAANYQSTGALFGARVIKPNLAVQIAFVTDALRFGYDGDAETDASLRSTANYLYWMCGKFQLEAQQIINGAGGGSVVPTPAGTTVNRIDFEVSSSSYMVTGDTTKNIPQFIGYNLQYDRDGVPQSALTTEPSYFTWNKTTGDFACSPALEAGEIIALIPV